MERRGKNSAVAPKKESQAQLDKSKEKRQINKIDQDVLIAATVK